MAAKALSLFFILLFNHSLWADAEFGVGMSSATSGRKVPALVGGINGDSWLVTATSTGVKTDYYYVSNYSVSYFKTWSAGELFWGEVSAGFGGGAFYNERAFQDEGSTIEENSRDFGLGPAFFVRWNVVGPVYLNIEVIWGLRDVIRHFTLNGQDNVTFSLGVRL